MNTSNTPDNTVGRKSALIIATLASFLTPFMVSSINIALPSIQQEFQMDALLLSWIPTSYLLGAAVSLVPFGRLADIHGRKKIFTCGISLYTVSTALAALSVNAIMLISLRIIQGVGSAMIFATGVAIVTSVFSPQERGKALGITVASVYIGLSLGPFLGGFLTQQFGWRSIFLFTLPISVTVIFLVCRRLKGEWAEARGEPFDLIGALIYGFTLISLMYGMSLLPEIKGGGLIACFALGALAFVGWETRIKNPVFEVGLFRRNRAFALSNLSALINYSATFALTFLLSLYLQYIKGLSPQNAGLILISQPCVMAVFSPFAGHLSDRIEPRIVASLGMSFTAAGLFFFTMITEETTISSIIGGLSFVGLGLALFSSPNINAIMSSVEKRFYGVASGSMGTMRLVGQMLSMGIVTLIFAVYIGKVQITGEYHSLFMKSMKATFIILSLLCFFGIFTSMARGKIRV